MTHPKQKSGDWLDYFFTGMLAFGVIGIVVNAFATVYLRSIEPQDPASVLMAAQDLRHYVFGHDYNSNGLAYHGIGYPALIWCLTVVLGNDVLAGVVLNLVMGAVFLWLAYRIIRELHSRAAALFAVALTAIMPPFIAEASSISDSMGAAMFCLAGVAAYLRWAKDGRMRTMFMAGIFLGLAYLFRYFYISMLVPLVLCAVLPKGGRMRGVMAAVCLCGGFILAMAPLGLATQLAEGAFFYNHSYATYAFNVLDKENSWLKFMNYAKQYHSMSDVMLSHPWECVRYATKNFYYFVPKFLFQNFYIVGALAPLGLFVALRRMNQRQWMVTLALGFAMMVVGIAAFLEYRYLLVMAPFYCLAAYVAVQSDCFPVTVGDLTRSFLGDHKVAERLSLRVAVLVVSFMPFLYFGAVNLNTIRVGEKETGLAPQARRAGEYLRTIPIPGAVASSVFSVGYYSKRRVVPLSNVFPRDSSFDALSQIDWAGSGIAFLIYVEGQSAFEYPRLSYLLLPESVREGSTLKLLKIIDGSPRIAIYATGGGALKK
ncbi:MAG: glycosyltransferase family 39 protein [Deltaproteobacteria bacterium]